MLQYKLNHACSCRGNDPGCNSYNNTQKAFQHFLCCTRDCLLLHPLLVWLPGPQSFPAPHQLVQPLPFRTAQTTLTLTLSHSPWATGMGEGTQPPDWRGLRYGQATLTCLLSGTVAYKILPGCFHRANYKVKLWEQGRASGIGYLVMDFAWERQTVRHANSSI